jgi:hypothetical protein
MEQLASNNNKLAGLFLVLALCVGIYWFGFRKPAALPMPSAKDVTDPKNNTSATAAKGTAEEAKPKWIEALMLDKGQWESKIDSIAQGYGAMGVKVKASEVISRQVLNMAKMPADNEWAHPKPENMGFYTSDIVKNQEINYRINALIALMAIQDENGAWKSREVGDSPALLPK